MKNRGVDFEALIAEQPTKTSSTGAELTIAQNLPPEALGMVLSMASREAGGFKKNILKLVGAKSIAEWFKKFFVGYGHKSIGDCGTTALAIDKVSMLTAISFEHHPLFSGQETSTRYVDVTGLDYIVPRENKELHVLIKECFQMYKECLEPLVEHMRSRYPFEEGWDPKVYETTVRTKALDVLGSLLPAGARTNISVVMNLRQMRDHLSLLRHHPLSEVREISESAIGLLAEEYPGAFASMNDDLSDPKNAEKGVREDYRKMCMDSTNYYQKQFANVSQPFGVNNSFDEVMWGERKPFKNPTLTERPERVEIPYESNELHRFSGAYYIDFRSFRDIHRQRSINQRIPLLTTDIGFEEWYLEQMPNEMKTKVQDWLAVYSEKLKALDLSPEEKQYLTPMGYKVFVKFSVGLAHLVYIIELRTQQTVHPTVRKVVKMWAEQFSHLLPEVKLYANMDEDKFDIRRGTQTITEKKA
jgi:thymidylate synthase ThyX